MTRLHELECGYLFLLNFFYLPVLFLVFIVYRYKYSESFHLASKELNILIGAINSIVLLLSGMTIGISHVAIQKGNKKLTLYLLAITIILGIVFLVNKYFEWRIKFEHGLYPGSVDLLALSKGDIMFFGLYFFMTGLHALHLIAGLAFISVVFGAVVREKVHATKFALLENCGLYWHLVDLVWLFLFPLFYLIN